MDKQAAKQLIENTFNYPFDIGKYKTLSRNIFKEFDEAEFSREGADYIPKVFISHINKYARLGRYKDAQGKEIDILIVYMNEGMGLDKARTLQRNFISNYLDDLGKDAALVAFTTSDMDDWRFSFITIDYKTIQDKSGKIKTKRILSNAKRFSFLVGKNEANHTAKQQIIPLLTNSDTPNVEDIEHAFSVEKVTNEFYQDYKKRFLELGCEINRVLDKDEKIKREFERQNIETDNFAKKLMGQIVFLYFVQKKGWLGVGKDDDGNFLKWGEGDKKFMRSLFEKKYCEYNNYFNDVLEPLFYEALATERANNFYSKFECKIPFLSGGLFEAMNGYNWQETDITISNNVIEMILDTFDRYNFTVKEDDPLDKEVAIDPEMLGKVFENLLPENLRKGSGSYYTPRPIVHYMCQESLINYLDTHLDIDKKNISLLIKDGDAIVEHDKIASTKKEGYEGKYQKRMPNIIIENANDIDKLLSKVKICDPAIGSGAFPMGLLHEIVVTRNVLTNYIGNEFNRTKFHLKEDCIQNSIYGVDIDEGAIEIAKLRLWLSLIVDEDDIENIKPLPNLDYKIICGNSLISRYELNSPIDVVFSEFNKKLKSSDYKNTAIRNLVGNQEVDLNFYKKISNDFITESSHNKKRIFRELIGEIKNAFKTEIDNKDRFRLSEARGTLENLKKIDIFGQVLGSQTEINKAKKKLDKLEKQKQETQDGALYKNAVEWRFEFPNLLNDSGNFMGFDIVIANPPYISYYSKQAQKLSNIEESHLRTKYLFLKDSTSKMRINSAMFFNEKGMSILKQNGVKIYIQDLNILENPFKAIRKYLSNKYKVNKIISGLTAFKNVGSGQVIIELNKIKELNNDVLFSENINNEFVKLSQEQIRCSENFSWSRNLNNSILEKIEEKSIFLSSYLNIHTGVAVNASKKGKELFILDNFQQGCYPLLIGSKSIKSSYCIPLPMKFILYSKELQNKVNDEFEKDYFERKGSRQRPFNIRSIKEYDRPKLILRQSDIKLTATYSSALYFGNYSLFNIYDANNNIETLLFTLSLINSRLLTFYAREKEIILDKPGKTPQIRSGQRGPIGLRQLPIKVTQETNKKKFAAIVDKIINAKKNKEDTTVLEHQVDVMVCKLYELTYEEVLIVDEEFALSEEEYKNFVL